MKQLRGEQPGETRPECSGFRRPADRKTRFHAHHAVQSAGVFEPLWRLLEMGLDPETVARALTDL